MTRQRLNKTRESVTHKVSITHDEQEIDLYITVGLYPDGKPGEVFAKIGRDDTAMLDQWCRAVSIILQDGHTVGELVRWFGHAKYSPAGFTDNAEIQTAHSLTDYIVRWMAKKFGEG